MMGWVPAEESAALAVVALDGLTMRRMLLEVLSGTQDRYSPLSSGYVFTRKI